MLNRLLTIFGVTCCAMLSAFDASIPVLDMNEYRTPETKDRFLQELHAACADVGFFALINTGVDPEVLDEGYRAVIEYFSLPLDEKMKSFDPAVNGQRGFVPGEQGHGSTQDAKEFMNVGRELPDEQLAELKMWKNIWPENFPLKQPLYALYDALNEEMYPIATALAECIGASSDLFTTMVEGGDSLLRVIHYPANPPKNQLWASEHTDITLFTILPKATAEGLQVLNNKGEWLDVLVPEGAFIINVGDMLENISNGELHSGLHRVVAKGSNYTRYSAVFFVHPKAADRLDPLPLCIEHTGGKPLYANANRYELLSERIVSLGAASPQMLQDLVHSGLIERLIEVDRASLRVLETIQAAGLATPEMEQELVRLQSSK